MPEQELSVIVSTKTEGDGFKEVVEGMQLIQEESADAAKSVTNATNAIAGGAKEAARGFGVFTRSLQDQIKYENDLVRAMRSGNVAIGNNITAARQAARGIGSISQPLQQATRQTANADAAFISLGRVASDLPFGFIAIQNNLDPLIQSFSTVFQRSNSVGEGFKAIGKSLLGGAGVGLAFSVVNSIVTTAIQRYGSLSNAIDAFLGHIDHQGSVIKEAAKEVGSDIAQIEILRTKLSDLNASQSERTKALEAYNKIADNANKINKNDINNLSEINRLLSQQIQLLQDRAIAAAAQKELSAAAEELFKVQRQTLPIIKKYTDYLQERSEASADAIKNTKGLRIATEEEAKADGGFTAAAKADLKQLENIQNSPEYKQAQKQLQEAQTNFNKVLGDVADLVTFDGISDKDADKVAKNTKTVQDVLKQLEQELTAVDVKAQTVGSTMKDLADDKIKAFERAIDSLLKLGVSPTSQFFTDFRKRIEEIQQNLTLPALQHEPVTVPVVAKPEFKTAPTTTQLKGLTDSFDRVFNDIAAQFAKITETAVENAIIDLSDAFGQALVTGDFSNVFKVLATSIGGYLQELGKVLVATGVGIEAFKKSLQTFQGVGAIVAGAALIAAGGAFKALASRGPSFAGGGAAFGPMLATVGDNAAHEEYIIPSEVLDKMGGMGPLEFNARISGNDLLLLLKRTEKENRR